MSYFKTWKLPVPLRIPYYDAKCRSLKIRRQIKNCLKKQVDFEYLFVLCPPYCGSTLMHDILCTSPFVSPNNIFGTKEGQSLPEYRKLVDHNKRWQESYQLPWQDINNIWMKYWDHSKPLLLEKSPPNLIHAKAIAEFFYPLKFVLMVRNPYVHCEALMRRNKISSKEAAKWSLQCLKHQKQNLAGLNNTILVRYEDLVDQPAVTRRRLLEFIPNLEYLDLDRKFSAHNRNGPVKIKNMNKGKIENIAAKDMQILKDTFTPEQALFELFDYDI